MIDLSRSYQSTANLMQEDGDLLARSPLNLWAASSAAISGYREYPQ